MRLLKKDLEGITFYEMIEQVESDGTNYIDFKEESNTFTGHVVTTLSGYQIKLYGKESTDMISIITTDDKHPNKGDKVLYNGNYYKVISTLLYKEHMTIDCKAML